MENYCGNREAFLYVYRSDADKAAGQPIIDALAAAGYRMFISSDFTAKDVRVLHKAAAAVLMMSSATLDELSPVVSAATKEDKPLIPVYLDALTLPAGMRMLLGPKQAHARTDYADDQSFAQALLDSPVLRELKVTPAQKKAAQGLLIGTIAAAAVIVAAVLLLLTLGRSAPAAQITGATLTQLGLSGDAAAVERVCLYGTSLRGGLEDYGAQNLNRQTSEGEAGIYLPTEDATVARGTLTDAADFAQLVNLTELALAGNAFADLTPLWSLAHLKRLDLSCNLAPISLEGVSALRELETLNIAYCKIDGGLEELAGLPALQTLIISSDYLDRTAELSARGVRVLCPSVNCADWESLQTWAPYEHVYELILSGNVTIPAGERLVVRKNVRLTSELGSRLDNRGTVELYGTWEMGMTEKNNYGAVVIRPGGLYSCGMGDSRNYGEFAVDAGGMLEIDRGEQFYMEGGSLTVDGTLRIGGGGVVRWRGGTVVNNGTIESGASERILDEMLDGRLADIRGGGIIEAAPEAAPTEAPESAPAETDSYADLPNDPEDLGSLDEYGMTPRERAYYDAYEFRSPTWSGGSVAEALTPYVDGDACMSTRSENSTAYLARSMTLPHRPLWVEGFVNIVVAPGATVTLEGGDWNDSLALTVLSGGTLIIDGDVMFQMAYNAGTLIVNGRLYAEAPSWGNKWGMFGNSGTVTVNGVFAPSQLYRFAGAEETGEIAAEEIFDFTDMAAPLQFAHGYHGMWQFAIFYDRNEVESMWWVRERDDRFDELPNDPEDLGSLDEYGMTPRERAYFDTLDFRYPTPSGDGTIQRPVTPYVDAESYGTRPPEGCEAYLARSMTVAQQPAWADGFTELFIAPGATVTLCGDWKTSLAVSILPGATLIIDGDVMYQMGYNAGTLIVNGRLYGESPAYGFRWGMFGNSGSITVVGSFQPQQLFRFKGAEETGEIDAAEILDFTDMEAPLKYSHGYHGLDQFAINCNDGDVTRMWWKTEEEGEAA